MSDLIDRQAAIDGLWSIHGVDDMLFVDAVVDMLENLPPADTEQRAENAHWITDTFHGNDVMSGGSMVLCSECGKGKYNGPTNYCPNCGTKMEVDDEP